ncbi:MAG: DUF1028 domain-containing protein [Thermoproteota archaeon]
MKLVSTYSIIAVCKKTGEMGAAVQSHWFSVGSVVPWAESGVGVVATQSIVEVSYGPLGLALMKQGKTPEQALKALLTVDPQREVRQVAMINVEGEVAVHTGSKCVKAAGHYIGDGFTVQANMVRSEKIWLSMAKAFESSSGSLAERLVSTLEAAEEAGGDLRGRQSAALLVVKTKPCGKPWEDIVCSLRIEDHPNPVEELKRLLRLHNAYQHANKGDELISLGKIEEAMEEYKNAFQLAPEVEELKFWYAVTLANHGMVEEAIQTLKETISKNKDLLELLKRLPESELINRNVAAQILKRVSL